MDFLEEWRYYEVLHWPPQSPYLSLIENIWNVMKMKLNKTAHKSDNEKCNDEHVG
jgi:hypothetical protein